MKNKIRIVVGILVFVIACMLPLLAVWRYTGFMLRVGTFRISASIFYAILLIDFALFYIQWKICPSIWEKVRYWFSDHVWSIMFSVVLVFIVQSLLFLRFYTLSAKRYRRLDDSFSTTISNQIIIEEKQIKTILEVERLARLCEGLESHTLDLKRAINNMDVPQKKQPEERPRRQINRGWLY